jgi:hypothetical protein
MCWVRIEIHQIGCCSLGAGKVSRIGVVQQIGDRLSLDVLYQASATTGTRIPLYLGVDEARTPMSLMRHGLAPDSLLDFLHLDRWFRRRPSCPRLSNANAVDVD